MLLDLNFHTNNMAILHLRNLSWGNNQLGAQIFIYEDAHSIVYSSEILKTVSVGYSGRLDKESAVYLYTSVYASSAGLHPALEVGLYWTCNCQVNAFDRVNFHRGFQSLMECSSWNRLGPVIQSKLLTLQLRKLTVHCVVHEGCGSGLVAKSCLTLVRPHGL